MDKKKKKKKLWIAFFTAVLILLSAAAAGYHVLSTGQETAEEVITLEKGQALFYVKINSIKGNDMAYTVVEETGDSMYVETQETGSLMIPVGTEIITKLGTVTNFSKLSNGDVVKLLTQETGNESKEILKIWMIG